MQKRRASAYAGAQDVSYIPRGIVACAIVCFLFVALMLRDLPRLSNPLFSAAIAALSFASVLYSAAPDFCIVLVWFLQFMYRHMLGIQLYANAFFYIDQQPQPFDQTDAVGGMLLYMARMHRTNILTVAMQILCGGIFLLAVVLTFFKPLAAMHEYLAFAPCALAFVSSFLFMAAAPFGNRFSTSDELLITHICRTVLFFGAVWFEKHRQSSALAASADTATAIARYMWLLYLTPYMWWLLPFVMVFSYLGSSVGSVSAAYAASTSNSLSAAFSHDHGGNDGDEGSDKDVPPDNNGPAVRQRRPHEQPFIIQVLNSVGASLCKEIMLSDQSPELNTLERFKAKLTENSGEFAPYSPNSWEQIRFQNDVYDTNTLLRDFFMQFQQQEMLNQTTTTTTTTPLPSTADDYVLDFTDCIHQQQQQPMHAAHGLAAKDSLD